VPLPRDFGLRGWVGLVRLSQLPTSSLLFSPVTPAQRLMGFQGVGGWFSPYSVMCALSAICVFLPDSSFARHFCCPCASAPLSHYPRHGCAVGSVPPSPAGRLFSVCGGLSSSGPGFSSFHGFVSCSPPFQLPSHYPGNERLR